MKPSKRIQWALLAAVSAVPVGMHAQQPANTNEVHLIRQEMDLLKQDYDRRMKMLEDRLNRLETPALPTAVVTSAIPPVVKATPPSAQNTTTNDIKSQVMVTAENMVANSEALAFAKAQFQRDTESRERALLGDANHPFKERVEKILKNFIDIEGYFRAGYGKNDEGSPQVAFQAPGAPAKYRLGNETENYGELVFGKNWYMPELFSMDPQKRLQDIPKGPIARTQIRLAFKNPYDSSQTADDFQTSLPEAWASIGNVMTQQPNMKFWAGNRFYRRHDIHINDFYYYNMSGAGGGVEDFTLPFGKMSLAWIGNGMKSGVVSGTTINPDPLNQAGFSKSAIDLRLYDAPVPLGKAEVGLDFAQATSGYDSNGNKMDGSTGFSLNFLHTHDHFISDNGYNKFSVQFGTGAAKTFTSGFETINLPQGVFINPDVQDSWRFRITEHFVVQPSEHFSIGPAFVYQYTDYRDPNASLGIQQWVSAGLRPIIHFTKNISLAFEGGVDYVYDGYQCTGDYLYKITIAPQVSLGGEFFSRPVIRAFVTYAQWGDSFVGKVGGIDYSDRNNGLTFGMQMETWW